MLPPTAYAFLLGATLHHAYLIVNNDNRIKKVSAPVVLSFVE